MLAFIRGKLGECMLIARDLRSEVYQLPAWDAVLSNERVRGEMMVDENQNSYRWAPGQGGMRLAYRVTMMELFQPMLDIRWPRWFKFRFPFEHVHVDVSDDGRCRLC
jgi:hypothetical protein